MANPQAMPTPQMRPSTNGINGVNGTHGVSDAESSSHAPIAIIGMACRFAGDVSKPSDLWDLCVEGRDCWSPIPKERFDVTSLHHSDKERPGRNHAIGGYFMREDPALFDAGFFNFSAGVASAMDPQIRLLLEVVYEATEDAGIPIESLSGTNTSVFSGCYGKDYHDMQTRDPEAMPPAMLTGNYTAMMSNRISHFYNLQGASMSIDTGCSSGLVCLHQGCLTIRAGESDISIVGASNTMLNPDLFIAMSSLGMVGTDGRSYAWDERAQGYGRGEGVSVLVLKSLDAALRDGDYIHAVVRNSGLNQDGKTQSITSPSVDAQVKLIRECYQRAGLDPGETGYVEAHMTGTQVGDLAESMALAQTFGTSRRAASEASDPVLVGSVKTSIGHTEGVSGLAGIIKAAYAMKNRQVPPNQNYKIGNPKIKLKDWHLAVPTSLTAWPKNKPLRVSINNFGYGGTNSHVILEGAPSRDSSLHINGHTSKHVDGAQLDSSHVFIVSSKDTNVTKTMARNLSAHLRQSMENEESPSLADIAYTLDKRRSRLDCISAVRARSLAELADGLESPALRVSQPAGKKPRLGFVFNGQGAQWHAMGRELLTAYPVFISAVAAADEILRGYGADWSLKEELMRDAGSTRVHETHLSQAVTVALQLCLVLLLRSWDVLPSAVASHSSGEIAAAFAAGALSFREALGAVYYRGVLAGKHMRLSAGVGGMAAAGISADDAKKYIANTTPGGRVVVACVNSPESVTLSGDSEDLDEVLTRLEADGIFSRKLKVGLAYHSHHMLPMASEYAEKLRQILPSKCTWTSDITYASPVTGGLVDSTIGLRPEHWVSNLTSPVLFAGAFEAMSESVDAVVEVGPHSTLSGPIHQMLRGRKVTYLSCLKRQVDAVDTMQDVACELLRLGYPVSLSAVNAGAQTPKFVPNLPTYAWNHGTRYWAESRINRDIRHKRFPPHELLGLPVSGGTTLAAEWRNFLRLSDVPWLVDHQVDAQVVLPGAAYISMAIEAARLLAEESGISPQGYRIRDAEFLSALTIPESSMAEVRLRLQPAVNSASSYDFQVSSAVASGAWAENCRGQISIVEVQDTSKPPNIGAFLDIGEDTRDIKAADLVARIGEMGIKYGPAFVNLTRGRAAANRAVTDLRISRIVSDSDTYLLHPTTLDCIVQSTYNALPDETGKKYIVLPRLIQHMFIPSHMPRHAGEELHVFTELQSSQSKGFSSTIEVGNAGGKATFSPLRIGKIFCQAIPRGKVGDAGDEGAEVSLYKSVWEPDTLDNIPGDRKDSMRITLTDDEIEFEKKVLRASYYFIFDAVSQLETEKKDAWEEHHKRMFDWMVAVLARGKKGEFGPGSKMWSRATRGMKQGLYDELNRRDSSGQLFVRVGTRLADIVRGQISPRELIEADRLQKYFIDLPMLKSRGFSHVASIAEAFAVKHPGANVLGIGAVAPSIAEIILDAFRARGDGVGTLLGRYTLADSSSDSISAAREQLAAWERLVYFEQFDIENDTTERSGTLITGSFDLVVGCMMSRTTRNLAQALKNSRKLLKPCGKLLLIETTRDKLDLQLILGTSSKWWSTEESVHNMSVENWDDALRNAGFTGVDFDLDDCEHSQLRFSRVILSSAAVQPRIASAVSVLYTTPIPEAWNTKLIDTITKQMNVAVTAESWDKLQPENKVYIFTGDMTSSFLSSLDQASFLKLQKLFVCSRGILWLSCGGAIDAQSPSHAMTQGFLRALRHEDTSRRIIHLDFEQNRREHWTLDDIDHIVQVFEQTMDEHRVLGDIDWEYAVKDNVLHVPRVFPDNTYMTAPEPSKQLFHQPGRTLVWHPSDSIFLDGRQAKTGVPGGMVEIEVRAFDVQQQHVASHDEDSLGYDFAGIVTENGPGTEKSGLQPGDRVAGLAKGSVASRIRVRWTHVVRIPEDMSFVDAACVPIAYATAYHALVDVARLKPGESVLIHQATDHASQAAIIIAQHRGAHAFVTIESELEQGMVDKWAIPPDRIYSLRDMSIATKLKTATKGKGVDVVFNSSPRPSIELLGDFTARFGRLVETRSPGARGGGLRSLASSQTHATTYSRLNIMEVAKYNDYAFREAIEAGFRICHTTRRSPARLLLPVVQYHISQMEEALRYRDQKALETKVIMVAGPEELVNVVPTLEPTRLSDPDATYLIVGGMGGIGQAIASWMMAKGAKNLLLISRNAEKHAGVGAILERAEKEACNIRIYNCDASCEDSLVKLLKCVHPSMPPIRGVVDAAMVLDDSVFERMTFEQWKRATLPKVVGTTHLEKHLSKELSFFILLSSVTGVTGHSSQGNYAAGNTFQDAFARHRTARGLPTVSINLSAVTGAGVVTNDEEARRRVEALGSKSISIENLLDLIGRTIQRRPSTPEEAQVIVNLVWNGLATDTAVRRDMRFGTLRLEQRVGGVSAVGVTKTESLSPSAMLAEALIQASSNGDAEAAVEAVARAVTTRLADIFNTVADEINLALPLAGHGVDSLVAVELRNWLATAGGGVKISIFEILQAASLFDVAKMVMARRETE